MDSLQEKEKFIKKLRNKYRLVIMNDSTFAEVFNYRLSRLNVFTLASVVTIILLTLGTLLVAFTPLRELIPNYPDGTMRRNIQMNALMIDSLENELKIRDQYLSNLKNIINGKETEMHELIEDTNFYTEEPLEGMTKEDSIFIAQFDEEEFYMYSSENKINSQDLGKIYFYAPVKGIITNNFNALEKHYGIDVVAAKDEAVLASLDGTIIIATWTLETGNIIQIQHQNNLISIYKHNSMLLKTVGNSVKAGEPIAIIGNSGELSTGPHLHFEIWHNGIPVDPEIYIIF